MEVRKNCKTNISVLAIPVSFDGGLASFVRAELINELLKYILFERQQMPLPLDHLKREMQQMASKAEQMKHSCRMFKAKRGADLIQKLEESMVTIKQAFEICPEIKKVVFTIGATPVSPKEVYVIEMPPLNPEADTLPSTACIKAMFRELIMQDPLRNMKQSSPTSVNILLNAPRNSELAAFFPKPTYSLPNRGKHFCFQLITNCAQGVLDVSKNLSDIELSGFEPFDELSFVSYSASSDRQSQSSEESISADYVCINRDISGEVMEGSVNSPGNVNMTGIVTSMESSHDEYKGSAVENNCTMPKRMKKSSSVSSLLSQSSVIGKHDNLECKQASMEYEESGTENSEYIWFQSPITMKGYKILSR